MPVEKFEFPPREWTEASGLYIMRMDCYVVAPNLPPPDPKYIQALPMIGLPAFFLAAGREMVLRFKGGKVQVEFRDEPAGE